MIPPGRRERKRGILRQRKTLVYNVSVFNNGVRWFSNSFSPNPVATPGQLALRTECIPDPIIHGAPRSYNPWAFVVYRREYVTGKIYSSAVGNPGDWTLYEGNLQSFDSNSFWMYPYPIPFDPDYLYSQALDRLNEKVRGTLDVSVAAFESRQTLRMIAALRKARRYITGFGSKRVANEWLEFTYGWKPLASDIFNIADESVRYTLNRIKHVRAGANDRPPGGRMNIKFSDLSSVPTDFKVDGIISTRFCLEFTQDEFSLDRWTSLNPLSIAWELMPYSFVVDWVYDIGGYLRNLETALLYNCRFVRGYRSHLYIANSEYEVNSFRYVTAGRAYDYTLKGCESYKGFRRYVLTSYPFPRPPSFRAELGSSRLLSAAALLRQLIRH